VKKITKKIMSLLLAISLLLFCTPVFVSAAPVQNMIMEIPNKYIDEKGNQQEVTIKVSVTGDEFYRRVTTLEGYTLIEDKDSGAICYATLNDKGEFISTKTPYTGLNTPREKQIEKTLSKGIKESDQVVLEIVNKNRKLMGRDDDEQRFLDSIKNKGFENENQWQYSLENMNDASVNEGPFADMYDSDALFWQQAAALTLSPEEASARSAPPPTDAMLSDNEKSGLDSANPKDLNLEQNLGNTAKREHLSLPELSRRSNALSESDLANGRKIFELEPSPALGQVEPLLIDAEQLPLLQDLYQRSRTDRFIVKYKHDGYDIASHLSAA